MRSSDSYLKVIRKIVDEDPRFPKETYFFVQDAVSYTIDSLSKKSGQHCGHITGQQLTEGIKEYLLEQYGPMASDVLSEWGVRCTRDFGIIVFNMVKHDMLKARKEDSLEDFEDTYDFYEEFIARFIPQNKNIKVPLIA